MSKVYCKGYNTIVHTYWGKGQAVLSDQAVRAGWGPYNHSVQTFLPPILQRRRLKSRDGEKLDQSPSKAGALPLHHSGLSSGSLCLSVGFCVSKRKGTSHFLSTCDRSPLLHPEPWEGNEIREHLPFAQCSWTVSDFSISKHEIV